VPNSCDCLSYFVSIALCLFVSRIALHTHAQEQDSVVCIRRIQMLIVIYISECFFMFIFGQFPQGWVLVLAVSRLLPKRAFFRASVIPRRVGRL
jgi:hypothetical protein